MKSPKWPLRGSGRYVVDMAGHSLLMVHESWLSVQNQEEAEKLASWVADAMNQMKRNEEEAEERGG